MSTWRGIPLQKAILVRHTPREHDSPLGRKNTGAIAMEKSGDALDYAGRYGEYADKGDIDRNATEYDRELAADYHESREFDAADRLDYAIREGEYVGKDRANLDASLWDQHGPVDRDEIQASMEKAGGAFVDSFITIGREYTKQLGIETKGDLQRLARSTWSESVERWGVIKNPEDIRWVAAAHFDANRSIHIHFYTWSAKGEIEPGWTVGREATREGKEIIYKAGYSKIIAERNERSNYLRDLARHEAIRQCGRAVDEKAERRLSAKASRLGYEERLSSSSSVSSDRKPSLERMQRQLSDELERGYGRLSDNWRANAIARDIVRELRASSPSFAHVTQEYERCLQVQADVKGYSEDGFKKEREHYLKTERDEYIRRVATGVRNAHLPQETRDRMAARRAAWEKGEKPTREEVEESRRRAKERKEKERQRAQEAQARLPISKVLAQHETARELGTSIKTIRELGRDTAKVVRNVAYNEVRNYEEAPRAVRQAANNWAEKMVKTSRVETVINRAVGDICSRNPSRSPGEVRESLSAQVQNRYARHFVSAAAEGRFGQPPELSRSVEHSFSGISIMGDIAESLVHAAASGASGAARSASGARRANPEIERMRFDEPERDR